MNVRSNPLCVINMMRIGYMESYLWSVIWSWIFNVCESIQLDWFKEVLQTSSPAVTDHATSIVISLCLPELHIHRHTDLPSDTWASSTCFYTKWGTRLKPARPLRKFKTAETWEFTSSRFRNELKEEMFHTNKITERVSNCGPGPHWWGTKPLEVQHGSFFYY